MTGRIPGIVATPEVFGSCDGSRSAGTVGPNQAVRAIAGQGSKIFTVREELETLLPGVDVRSGFQETAIARGLALQCGVLSGFQRDLLLHKVLRFGVGVRYAKELSSRRGVPHAIYQHRSDNRDVMELLLTSTKIPWLQSKIVHLSARQVVHELEFVEIPEDSGLVFGTIPVVSEGDAVELTADVDVAGMVVLSVKDFPGGAVIARHDLNQLACATLAAVEPAQGSRDLSSNLSRLRTSPAQDRGASVVAIAAVHPRP